VNALLKEGKTTMVKINPTALSTDILTKAQPKLRPFENAGGDDFANQMTKMLGEVAKVQAEADQATKAYQAGDEVDVTKVMLAREKSSLAFEATVQIRNKLLSAYKDITTMPV
jgi:flagellar hook-basal body complex protein FliE